MLSTKEKAQKLWCPHVQEFPVPPKGNPCNRWSTDNPTGIKIMAEGHELCCIADKCSQWRWAWDKARGHRRFTADGQNILGYCGLAGRPEE